MTAAVLDAARLAVGFTVGYVLIRMFNHCNIIHTKEIQE